MICDEDKAIRQLGWRRIAKARSIEANTNTAKIRNFKIPTLNFSASKYYDIIYWQSNTISEPPCTRNITKDELNIFIQTGEPFTSIFTQTPCHTQAVERSVKLITEASTKVSGQTNREAYIQCTLQSRKEITSFDTKKHHK